MAAGFDLLDFASRFSDAQALLLDAHVDGYGGGGKVFDWSLIPHNVPRPVVLSGGLHAGNVIDGIQLVRPWAVDVSSGVESAKGIKDAEAIRRFCEQCARPMPASLHRLPDQNSPTMSNYQQPDASGHFGPYGGTFVAETLVHALDELKRAYAEVQNDPAFIAEFQSELAHFVGRPSPIYHAARMSRELGGAQIYLKREDLNHTGAHKINNTIGQAMLARRMGKPRVIAETGAGQHGVATATICARYGLECVVYMGSEDVKRQSPNVYRMNLLGATVVPVESGSKTLKDALNEALRDWVTNVENTFYIIGTVAGPHPYPMMVRDFQRVIGDECLVQMPQMTGRQPDAVIACVGGGSNAMGIFYPYIDHAGTRLIGVEAAGQGLDTGQHAASLSAGLARRAARQPHLPAAGRERPDHRNAFDLGRSRLPRRRPRARVPEGHRPRRIRRHHRRRGAGRVPPPVPHRRHHPGARIEPCGGLRDEDGADDAQRPAPAGQPLGPRRQGHRHRRRPVGRRLLLPAVVPGPERQGLAQRS